MGYFCTIDLGFIDFACGVFVGSLLPDIDTKKSIAAAVLPAYLFLNHGTLTHTLLFNIVLLAMWYFFLRVDSFLGICVGVFLHNASDNFDGYALKMWFWPIITKRGKQRKT